MLARPLLKPLKPRWFLCLYGLPLHEDPARPWTALTIEPNVPYSPQKLYMFPRQDPSCGLQCYVRLELLPDGFKLAEEEGAPLLSYCDHGTESAVGRATHGQYTGWTQVPGEEESTCFVPLRSFGTAHRFAYHALSAYVESLMCDGSYINLYGPTSTITEDADSGTVSRGMLTSFARSFMQRVVLEAGAYTRPLPSST